MAIPKELEARIRQGCPGTAVEPVVDRVIELVRPAVGTIVDPDAVEVDSRSRLAGLPDVPPDWAWPESADGYLRFLGQIELSDLAPFEGTAVLPRSGVLSFFYGPEPYGASQWEEMNAARVFHFPTEDLRAVDPPTGIPEPLEPTPLLFEQEWSMPRDKDHLAVKALYSGMATDKAQDVCNDLLDFEPLAGPLRILSAQSKRPRPGGRYTCSRNTPLLLKKVHSFSSADSMSQRTTREPAVD